MKKILSTLAVSATLLCFGSTAANAQALNFGAYSYVTIGNILSNNQSYTKEAWIRMYPTAAVHGRNIVSSYYSSFGVEHGALSATNTTGTANVATVTDPDTFALGAWTHVAVTYDAATSTMKLYKNGILTASNTVAPSYTGTFMQIGAIQYTDFLDGTDVDEVRVWGVARTQAQIQAYMNCDVTGQANLLAYYKFDEGTPGGNNTGLAGATDNSGNGNTGIFSNFNLTGTYTNYIPGRTISTVGTIAGATATCTGNTITLTDTSAGGTWSTSSASLATVGSAGLVTGVAAGTPVISYTAPNGCIAMKNVTVNTVAPITGTASACTGNTTTLSDTTSGGAWSSSNTTLATVGSTGIVSAVSAGTPVISYTSANGCVAVKNVTVNTVAAISGSASVCTGSSVTLSDATSGGTWSSGSTTVATVGSTGIVSGVSAGTPNITYTAANGCVAVKGVTVNSVASISGSSSVCTGGSLALSDATSGGTWSSSNTSMATVGSTGIVSGVSHGTPTISYTAASGCVATVAVTINTSPTISASVTNASCNGKSDGSINTTVTGGASPYTYSWSNGSAIADPTGLPAGSYTVTATDAKGCTVVSVYTVTQPAPGSATVTVTPNDNTYTDGVNTHIYLGYGAQQASLSCSTFGWGWGWGWDWGSSYSWSPSPYIDNCNSSSPNFTPSVTGTYSYTCTVTNSSGCKSAGTVSFCVYDAQDHSNHGKVILCHGAGSWSVNYNSVDGHLRNHGDHLGLCGGSGYRTSEDAQTILEEDGMSVTAFPNPFNDEIHIKIQTEFADKANIVVYDLMGRVVETARDLNTDDEINIGANLPKGMYVMQVSQGNVVKMTKIVKN